MTRKPKVPRAWRYTQSKNVSPQIRPEESGFRNVAKQIVEIVDGNAVLRD